MRIVPYRHSAIPMQRFVMSTFALGSGAPAKWLRDMLMVGARVVIAIGDDVSAEDPQADDPFYGWAAEVHGSVIWVYVKPIEIPHPDGSLWRNRNHGLAKNLLATLGFTRAKAFPVLFDAPAIARWIARGWPIIPPRKEPTHAA